MVPSVESTRSRVADEEESKLLCSPDTSVTPEGAAGKTDLTGLGSRDIFLVATVGELSGVLLRLGSLPTPFRALLKFSSSA